MFPPKSPLLDHGIPDLDRYNIVPMSRDTATSAIGMITPLCPMCNDMIDAPRSFWSIQFATARGNGMCVHEDCVPEPIRAAVPHRRAAHALHCNVCSQQIMVPGTGRSRDIVVPMFWTQERPRPRALPFCPVHLQCLPQPIAGWATCLHREYLEKLRP